MAAGLVLMVFAGLQPSSAEGLGEGVVYGRLNGEDIAHQGEVNWDEDERRLEIEVGSQSGEYELLVQSEWMRANLRHPTFMNIPIGIEKIKGVEYHVTQLGGDETPTTVTLTDERINTRIQYPSNEQLDDFEGGWQRFSLVDGTGEGIVNLEPIEWDDDLVDKTSNLDDGELNYLRQPEVNEKSRVVRTVLTTEGLYGSVHASNQLFYFKYDGTLGDDHLPPIHVCCGEGGGDNDPEDPEPDPEPDTYPYNPPEMVVDREVFFRSYTEEEVVDEFGCFFSGLDGEPDDYCALDHQLEARSDLINMWRIYTGNLQNVGHNTQVDNLFTGGGCSDHREAFTDFVENSGDRDTFWDNNPFFVLIKGNTDTGTGCARAFQNGVLVKEPDSVNLGLDTSTSAGQYNGASDPHHLGTLIGQEVGHNWGERGHPCESVDGEYSLMANTGDCQAPWDDRKFWLHYDDPDKPSGATDSRQRIIDGTSCYDQENWCNDQQ